MNNFYADTRSAPYIAKLVIYVTQTLLGDGFMVSRLQRSPFVLCRTYGVPDVGDDRHTGYLSYGTVAG